MRPTAVHVVHVRTDHPSVVGSHDGLVEAIVVCHFLGCQIEHHNLVLQRIVCHRKSSQLRRQKIVHFFVIDLDDGNVEADVFQFGEQVRDGLHQAAVVIRLLVSENRMRLARPAYAVGQKCEGLLARYAVVYLSLQYVGKDVRIGLRILYYGGKFKRETILNLCRFTAAS